MVQDLLKYFVISLVVSQRFTWFSFYLRVSFGNELLVECQHGDAVFFFRIHFEFGTNLEKFLVLLLEFFLLNWTGFGLSETILFLWRLAEIR